MTPQITPAAIVTNGAGSSEISPGALITIFGTNLSNNVHGIAGSIRFRCLLHWLARAC